MPFFLKRRFFILAGLCFGCHFVTDQTINVDKATSFVLPEHCKGKTTSYLPSIDFLQSTIDMELVFGLYVNKQKTGWAIQGLELREATQDLPQHYLFYSEMELVMMVELPGEDPLQQKYQVNEQMFFESTPPYSLIKMNGNWIGNEGQMSFVMEKEGERFVLKTVDDDYEHKETLPLFSYTIGDKMGWSIWLLNGYSQPSIGDATTIFSIDPTTQDQKLSCETTTLLAKEKIWVVGGEQVLFTVQTEKTTVLLSAGRYTRKPRKSQS